MTDSAIGGFRALASVVLCATLACAAAPSAASGYTSGPLKTWLYSLPASCPSEQPAEAYWVGGALDRDERQFPELLPSFDHPRDDREYEEREETDRLSGSVYEGISASYDPVHRIAAFHITSKSGEDVYRVIADAPAPPKSPKVKFRDLSRIVLGGNIELGATLADVASAVGLHELHPSPAGSGCGGYTVEGFCSFDRPSCECPRDGARVLPDTYGTVTFLRGRVAALTLDLLYCRP